MQSYSPLLNRIYRSMLFVEGVLGKQTHAAQMIVLRGDDVLLIRTRYRPHWEFPGGKAERGEAPETAAVRETKEEAGVFVRQLRRKLGTYTFRQINRRALIHVFVADEWHERDLWSPSLEIAERGFFPLASLPEDISAPTMERIKEFQSGKEKEFFGVWE